MGLIDSLLNPLERLITEHGSAAILRERLDLIKAKLTEEEARHAQLEAEHRQLQAEFLQMQQRARELEQQVETLTRGQNMGMACDKCGSPQVRRSGSRPDPTFGDLGIKQGLFTCADCGHISAVTLDPL